MASRIETAVIVSGLSHLYGDDLSGLLETARIADDAGVDRIVMTDHLAIGPRTDRYPYGRFPYTNAEPWPEPLTTLAAMAGATARIRLCTGILIAPLRPALLLAKTLATLDALSRGRLEVGVGIGWQPEEFAAAGVPFRGRGARLDDTLRACRVLWRAAPASFRSSTVSFEDLVCLPRPVQPSGVPIWFGLRLSARNVQRIVEFGAGWMPVAAGPNELAPGIRTLRDAFVTAGHDPDALRVSTAAPAVRNERGEVDLERTLAALPELAETGIGVASFALARFARRPEDIRPFLERLGRRG